MWSWTLSAIQHVCVLFCTYPNITNVKVNYVKQVSTCKVESRLLPPPGLLTGTLANPNENNFSISLFHHKLTLGYLIFCSLTLMFQVMWIQLHVEIIRRTAVAPSMLTSSSSNDIHLLNDHLLLEATWTKKSSPLPKDFKNFLVLWIITCLEQWTL